MILVEGGDFRIVEGEGRSRAGVDDVALVELQLHRAGDGLLRLGDERTQRLAQRAEPLAEIHQLGKAVGDQLLVVLRVAIQAQRLQHLMRAIEDRSAGRLVNAAALHAYKAVLKQIDQTHAVLAAQLVQLFDQLDRADLFTVQRDRNTLFKRQRNISGLVGGHFGGNAHLQEAGLVILRLVRRILEVEALVREMPQVLVLRIVRLAVDLQRDIVRLGVVDLLLAGLDAPLTPRGDDRHLRRKRLDRQLETHLIVAFARAAVADRVRTLGQRDFNNPLGDHRPRKRRAQQIFALVHRARLHRGEDVVLDEFLLQILDIQLGGAGLDGLLLQAVQLGALTHVARHGDNLAVVVILLQPRDDDRGIQTAGIGQHDFFDVFLIHDLYPPDA